LGHIRKSETESVGLAFTAVYICCRRRCIYCRS